jgi:hypothetical protein
MNRTVRLCISALGLIPRAWAKAGSTRTHHLDALISYVRSVFGSNSDPRFRSSFPKTGESLPGQEDHPTVLPAGSSAPDIFPSKGLGTGEELGPQEEMARHREARQDGNCGVWSRTLAMHRCTPLLHRGNATSPRFGGLIRWYGGSLLCHC